MGWGDDFLYFEEMEFVGGEVGEFGCELSKDLVDI